MSRVTPPVTKLTHAVRSMSTSAIRSSNFLDQSRHVSIYLPRKLSELKAECDKRKLKTNGSKLELVDRLTAHDVTSTKDFHSGGHRPTSRVKTIPLMQTFQTTAPKQTARDTSTIDFFFFPEVPEPPPENPFAQLRVPLLPDNYNPDRSAGSAHAVESFDEALARPEISVMASHPEYVLPTAMSEVVGNDGMDVDLGSLTAGFTYAPSESAKSKSDSAGEPKEEGLFKELWTGIVGDILGSKPKVA